MTNITTRTAGTYEVIERTRRTSRCGSCGQSTKKEILQYTDGIVRKCVWCAHESDERS